MKIRIIKLIALASLFPIIVFGQVRGVSVIPSEIIIDNNKQWPHVIDVIVRNEGGLDEWVEVAVFGDVEYVNVTPSRFVLEAKQSARFVVTFDKSSNSKVVGSLSVSATRNNTGGATVGTGVVIPFAVNSQSPTILDVQLAAATGAIKKSDNLFKIFVFTLILIFAVFVIGRFTMIMTISKNKNNE